MRQGDCHEAFPLDRRYRRFAYEELESFLVREKIEQSLPLVCLISRFLPKRMLVTREVLHAHLLRRRGEDQQASE